VFALSGKIAYGLWNNWKQQQRRQMNKAQIKLELNELITIDNIVYQVAEHPALPGVPYIQRGARGFVIQLKAPNSERFALKYFKIKYRVSELVSIGRTLRQFADLPGLRAAYRTIFTVETHVSLIRRYPALEYGVLMPWLPGMTWFDVMTKKMPLAPLESVKLAQQAAKILAGLEANGLAHCDIAGANVMIDRRTNRVELVDIEEMHGAGLPRPVELPAGQQGYQHRASANEGQWREDGDRFGGAILISEMLAWHSNRMRDNSADEHFFAAAEVQQPDTPRFRLMFDYLRSEYSPELAEAFERAWRSAALSECPPLSLWSSLLDQLDTVKLAPAAPAPRTNEVISGRRQLVAPPPIQVPTTIPELDVSVTDTPVSPAAPVLPAPSVPTATKLCPRCGAANLVGAEFCVKCHYYLKGEQRPARGAMRPMPGQPAKPGGSANSPANYMASGNISKEVIASRRTVDGKPIAPPPEPNIESKWVMIAVVVGVVLMLLIFALFLR